MRGHFVNWVLVGLAVCATACSFDQSGIAFNDASRPIADARVIDGQPGVDAQVAIDASCNWAFNPVYFDACGVPAPSGDLVLDLNGVYVFDTDSGSLHDPNLNNVGVTTAVVVGGRALVANNVIVTVGSTLRFEGAVPALLIAFGDITVSGTVEANSYWDSSAQTFVQGAGANAAACPTSPPDPGAECAMHGGSGGGGGAFGGDGGAGGAGGVGHDCGGGNPNGIAGGAGGIALGSPPGSLRGGCAGREGSQNNSGNTDFGPGGPGGGALHITAAQTITVSGKVHAGGSGGGAGLDKRSGGGGGGSGGMLGLEATSIVVLTTGVVAANGGGGGGGAENAAAMPGENGQPSGTAASGGAGQNNGGPGGAGGASTSPDGVSADPADRGGGGGGGGVGFILFYSVQIPAVDALATISPPATTP